MRARTLTSTVAAFMAFALAACGSDPADLDVAVTVRGTIAFEGPAGTECWKPYQKERWVRVTDQTDEMVGHLVWNDEPPMTVTPAGTCNVELTVADVPTNRKFYTVEFGGAAKAISDVTVTGDYLSGHDWELDLDCTLAGAHTWKCEPA